MTLTLRTHILVAGFLWSALLFAIAPGANAGTILGAPTYMGLNSGLEAYWTFDGKNTAANASGIRTFFDKSGNGRIATTSGSVLPQIVPGKLGQALTFDGVNDYADVAVPSSWGFSNAITWSAWVKKNVGIDTVNNYVFIARWVGDNDSFSMELQNNGNGNDVMARISNTGSGGTTLESSRTITDSEWHHYTGVFNGATGMFQIWIDGVLDNQVNTGYSAFHPIQASIELGGWPTSGFSDTFMNGILDDVRIYNRALTPDEIKRLYKIGSTLKYGAPNSSGSLASGLVGWWTMDGNDVAGNVAYDRSGNGANGTLASGPTRTIGKIGQAIKFNGEGNGVLLGQPASLTNLQSVSISAWIKLDTYPTCGGDLDIIEKGGPSSTGWKFTLPCNITNGLYFTRYTTGSNPDRMTADNSISVGQWQHVLVTFASSTAATDIHIYVNGTETTYQVSNNGTGGLFNDTGFDGNISTGVDGVIDDVRIYNRALSTDEIKRLYNMGR